MSSTMNGHRTYKDLIQNRTPPYTPLAGMRGRIAHWMSFAIQSPLLGGFLRHFFHVVCIALVQFRHKQNYAGLYDVLMNTLLAPHFRKERTQQWWYLMRFGVAITQERQLNWLMRDWALEDNLILLGSLGPKPWQGYDVAYVFVGYSLWLFERGDVHGALNMVQVAVQADETWGYPEYLQGWYGLFTTGVDSVAHFARAVQIDWSFLQRMKHDRMCCQHPEVLREVHKRTLVAK